MTLKTVAFLASLLWACAGHAAFDAYLKIEGIDGGSTDARHPKWIVIDSFAHGAARPGLAGAPSFAELCVQRFMDISSPVLEQKCAQGTKYPSATLELVTADASRVLFYQIVLSNVLVSSISASGSASADSAKPLESLCLNYSQISWTYTAFDASGVPAGDVKAWWDLALGIGNSNINPVLRVTGTQVDSTSLRLSWPAKAGKTYDILASSNVIGTYQRFQSVPAAADGPMSFSVPIAGRANFFRIQEAP